MWGKPGIGSGSALNVTVGVAAAIPGNVSAAQQAVSAASAASRIRLTVPSLIFSQSSRTSRRGCAVARAAANEGRALDSTRLPDMDPDRARELLEGERQRVEQALAGLRSREVEGRPEQDEPGERDSEDLNERGLDDARQEDLTAQLAAVERAEARLAAGTYGRSVRSGEPIPDERLEALPTAELTVEEQSTA